MNISDLAADYPVDKKEGMRHLTEMLLNEVMQLEALRQIQAQPLTTTTRGERTVNELEIETSRPFTEK
jgi:hypothetical protein